MRRWHGPIPQRLFEQAERLFSELLASNETPVLLHGDLHHFNILSSGRERWLAIDPKGLVGEAEYELAAFLRNRLISRPQPRKVLARRVDQFVAELGFDRKRIVGWAQAGAVLSATWGHDGQGRIKDDELAYMRLTAEL